MYNIKAVLYDDDNDDDDDDDRTIYVVTAL